MEQNNGKAADDMAKLRVWWVPQVPMEAFYIPVNSPEEGRKVMDMLAAYDCFQYNHKVKPDYCNTGGLQQYDSESGEWEDWFYDDGDSYYENEDLDEYCEEKTSCAKELEEDREYLFSQVHFDDVELDDLSFPDLT